MLLTVSPADDLPIYRQIMRQVMDAIAGGQLAPGDQLPSHRELSERLVIAPLTVKKAYDEMEKLGYVISERGRGTFVAESLPRSARRSQDRRLTDAAQRLLTQAYLAGLSLADVVELLESADRTLAAQPPAERTA